MSNEINNNLVCPPSAQNTIPFTPNLSSEYLSNTSRNLSLQISDSVSERINRKTKLLNISTFELSFETRAMVGTSTQLDITYGADSELIIVSLNVNIILILFSFLFKYNFILFLNKLFRNI